MIFTSNKVRVRFAPSPTGFLHVGGLRTALFNYLFAKKHKGIFILRVEDTDKSREVKGAVENITETLKHFSLNFDEGPIFQSARLQIYKKHIDELVDKGQAYKCYCSGERIAGLKKQTALVNQPFRYDKHCLRNPSTLSGNKTFVVRQNVPEEGVTEFDDIVYGHIKVENRLLDDGVLVKSDGWPVYNFANVVDDHDMQISHVIRGEEFIPSTPKHILLYQAFGWGPPKFAHLPLLLDKKRHKLSKRTVDTAVKEYMDKGYLPEAILNFIAFLGWNPKTEREFFSLEDLIEAFDLEKVNKAGAVFDAEKLDWFNKYYIKQKPLEELTNLLKPYFPLPQSLPPREGKEGRQEKFLQKIVEIERERLTKLSEIGERVQYFFSEPTYDKELLRWKQMTGDEIKDTLKKAEEILNSKVNPSTSSGQKSKAELQEIFFKEIGEGDKGAVLWPLRVALTGLAASPSPFEILEAFLILPNGKDIVLERLRKAIVSLREI